jgi:hypothetical protein
LYTALNSLPAVLISSEMLKVLLLATPSVPKDMRALGLSVGSRR